MRPEPCSLQPYSTGNTRRHLSRQYGSAQVAGALSHGVLRTAFRDAIAPRRAEMRRKFGHSVGIQRRSVATFGL